jgi:hypothetical protein
MIFIDKFLGCFMNKFTLGVTAAANHHIQLAAGQRTNPQEPVRNSLLSIIRSSVTKQITTRG